MPSRDDQKMRRGRVTKDASLQMTIGAEKVKINSVAMREMEPEKEGNLGRRGMMILVVWMLVRQKHKVEYTSEEENLEMFQR
jgi:hypothetical protein